jgi:hypothetical protein
VHTTSRCETPINQQHLDPRHLVNPKAFLLAMLQLHPKQREMKQIYNASIKPIYVLLLFCSKIRSSLMPEAVASASVKELLQRCEYECRFMSNATSNASNEGSGSTLLTHFL